MTTTKTPRARQTEAAATFASWVRRGYVGATEIPELLAATYERDKEESAEPESTFSETFPGTPFPGFREWLDGLLAMYSDDIEVLKS